MSMPTIIVISIEILAVGTIVQGAVTENESKPSD